MAFADLKNDFVFRRIFAMHPDKVAATLDRWLARAVIASSLEDVFASPETSA